MSIFFSRRRPQNSRTQRSLMRKMSSKKATSRTPYLSTASWMSRTTLWGEGRGLVAEGAQTVGASPGGHVRDDRQALVLEWDGPVHLQVEDRPVRRRQGIQVLDGRPVRIAHDPGAVPVNDPPDAFHGFH